MEAIVVISLVVMVGAILIAWINRIKI